MTRAARPPTPLWPSLLLLVAASIVYCAPLFAHLDWYGWQDWDQFTFRYETPRVALLRDWQWPVWNPYANGGTALLAHPHSPVLSPWYVITLLLGAPVGLRVQVVVFMALGAVGMAALMRQLGAGRVAGISAGIVLMMSAHFALHITEGHLEWTALGVMPWVVLGLVQAQQSSLTGGGRAPVIRSALLFASILTLGAVYVPAVYVPFLTVWMAFECVRQRRVAPLAAWVVVAVLAAGLAGAKLVPMSQFTSEHARQPTTKQRTTVKALAIGLLSTDQAARYAEYKGTKRTDFDASTMPLNWHKFDFEFHEYGTYPGVVGGLAVLVGFIATARTRWPLYAAGGVLAWIMLGSEVTPDLWALLRSLPMYDQMQAPSRILATLVFVAAVAAGWGMDELQRRITASRMGAWRTAVPWVVCALLYGELAIMGHSLFAQVFRVPPIRLQAFSDFAQRPAPPESKSLVPDPMKSVLYPRLLANWGALDGYENLSIATGRVLTTGDPGYRGEVYLSEGAGRADVESWTMAHVQVRVRADGPAVVVMNQNYDTGWSAARRASGGVATTEAAVRTQDGLIGAKVERGESVVEFRYWPRGLTAGIWLSVGTLLLCLAGLRRW